MKTCFRFRPLHAIMLILALTVVFAAIARYSGLGILRMPEPAIVQYRDLRFTDRADGSVGILDASNDAIVTILEPGQGGFIRGVLRGRARERRLGEFGPEPPFRLARHADGRLTLEDTATKIKIVLSSFGPSNVEAFARLLP
ncbi:MAG: photosynthetic complex assembly protein PuhC [Bosea sp. (in: a-proteobacteria)]